MDKSVENGNMLESDLGMLIRKGQKQILLKSFLGFHINFTSHLHGEAV